MPQDNLSDRERERRLRDLLKRFAPEGDLGNLKETLESSSGGGEATDSLDNLGFGDANASDEQIAVESLDVLINDPNDGALRPDQLFGLEAIIHKRFRPAVFVQNNSFKTLPHPWQHLGGEGPRAEIEAAFRSIGRIEVPGHPSLPYAGTGFVVGENLLMTNRHVASIFCRGLGRRQVRLITGMWPQLDLLEEHLNPDELTLEVTGVEMIHPFWDMALLKVSGLPEQAGPLTLSTTRPESIEGEDVVIVGYPAMDPRNDINLQNQIFHGVYDVKRLQPGKLLKRQNIDSFENSVNSITHDCSTLGGNSGSALLHVPTGQIVGLHFAGIYLKANYAVPAFDMASDQAVVQSGVNFAEGDIPASSDYAAMWRAADSKGFDTPEVARVNPSSGDIPNLQSPPPKVSDEKDSSLSLEWTQPIHFSVRVGTPVAGLIKPEVSVASSPPPPIQTNEGRFRSQQVDDEELTGEFDLNSLLSDADPFATAYSLALASQLAYESPAVVQRIAANHWNFTGIRSIHVRDTQCFFASTDDVNLVAFRGTESLRDWLTDLKILSAQRSYGRVHRGFLGAFQDVQSRLADLILAEPNKRLVLTGHSLGGALAVVAAAEWGELFDVDTIFTFGQPAVGKGDFAPFMTDRYGDRHIRLVNDDDIVAKVPPTFVHTGRLIHFQKGSLIESLSASSPTTEAFVEDSQTAVGSPTTLSEEQFGILQEELELAAATTPPVELSQEGLMHAEGFLPSFRDHKIANYVDGLLKLSNGDS